MNALARTVEVRGYRALAMPLTAPLLDLGCGDGGVAQMLTALGHMEPPLCGLDISASDLTRANSKGIHEHIVRGDARALPFPDGRFATVLANGVLCCVPQGADAAVAEITRILRPGGVLVAAVPTADFSEVLLPTRVLRRWAPRIARLYGRRVDRRLTHATTAAPEEWMKMLERHGLVVERHEPMFSPATGGPWSLLFLHLVRVFGALRLSRLSRVGRPLSKALFARAFARLYLSDRDGGPPFGYVLIAARRPDAASTASEAA